MHVVDAVIEFDSKLVFHLMIAHSVRISKHTFLWFTLYRSYSVFVFFFFRFLEITRWFRRSLHYLRIAWQEVTPRHISCINVKINAITVVTIRERFFGTFFFWNVKSVSNPFYCRTVYMFVGLAHATGDHGCKWLYSHLVFLFLYASFSISKMSDQDLLEQIKIGKSNLPKALMTGDKDLIEMVGFLS